MTSKNNHLQLGATDSGGMAFICLHCGTIVLPLMPITFPDMDQRNDKFLQEHSNCPCPESGPHDGLRLLVKAGLRTPP